MANTNPNKALIVIDVQEGMFNEAFPVHNGAQLLGTLGKLIERARAANTPVIYVQHIGEGEGNPLRMDSPGFPIRADIAPKTDEIIVQKRTPDSFHETTLHQTLQARGIQQLVMCGIQTDYCVDTSVRRAMSLGYKVTVPQDGHSTWPDHGLSAEQIIHHHNAVLANWFAQVKPTAEIEFS